MQKRSFPFTYLALVYAVLIFVVSGIPSISPPSLGFEFEDKILHFIEYSVFSGLLFLAFYASGREFFKKNVFLLACVIGIAYAVSDEIHQKFVPGRSCEFLDFAADCLGIVLMQIGIWLYLKRKRSGLTAP